MPAKRRYFVGIQALLCLSLVATGLPVFAQSLFGDPDWQELEVPPPPAFSKERLIPVDMPPYVSLKFGVDPATLGVGNDGILRYVMVASNESGSVNAMYEGLRCASGEFKTYARFSASGQWVAVKEPQWRALNANNTSKHAQALARQGACNERSLADTSVQGIVRALKSGSYDVYRK